MSEGKKIVGYILISLALIYLIFMSISSFGNSPIKYCWIATPSGIQQDQLIGQVMTLPTNQQCDTTRDYFYLADFIPSQFFNLMSIIFIILGGILLYEKK